MSAGSPAALPWRPLPHARPLRAWRTHELARLGAKLEGMLLEWVRAWDLPVDAAAPVNCVEGDVQLRSTAGWVRLGADDLHAAWLRPGDGEGDRMAAQWFAADAGSTHVVRAVVRACQQDLFERAARGLEVGVPAGPVEPPGDVFAAWSGTVIARLPWGAGLLVTGAALQRLLRPVAQDPTQRPAARSRLIPVGEALAHTRLHLQVDLEACELGLGELQGLQPGDVLRLAHRVDAPARVRHAAGPALFQGWLARSHGRKAIELAPAAAPASRAPSAKEEQ